MARKLSKDKALKILEEGKVHGKPLTSKQEAFFGWVAGGRKNPRPKKRTTKPRESRRKS